MKNNQETRQSPPACSEGRAGAERSQPKANDRCSVPLALCEAGRRGVPFFGEKASSVAIASWSAVGSLSATPLSPAGPISELRVAARGKTRAALSPRAASKAVSPMRVLRPRISATALQDASRSSVISRVAIASWSAVAIPINRETPLSPAGPISELRGASRGKTRAALPPRAASKAVCPDGSGFPPHCLASLALRAAFGWLSSLRYGSKNLADFTRRFSIPVRCGGLTDCERTGIFHL